MKVKKYIILFLVCIGVILDAGTVQHSLISVTEHKIMGHLFKHVMTSADTQKDQFFIDGSEVVKEKYHHDLEQALQKERDDDRAYQEKQRRANLEFFDTVQVEIAAKLLQKTIDKIQMMIKKIENPALESFFVFNDLTVNSSDQLHDLKNFVNHMQGSIVRKVENFDYKGLNVILSHLEVWPDRLEKFFQATVHHAIKKSDDTAILKELLRLV